MKGAAMHILVATDGSLDPEQAADAVARWHTEGDEVVVFTTMNVPTDFLDHLGDPGIREAAHIALEAGQGIGDRAAEQLVTPPTGHAPVRVDNSPVVRSLKKTAASRTTPIVAALKARGITAMAKWSTNNNRTARSILTAVDLYDSELLVIGSSRSGRLDGLLGSTGTKLARHSPIALLMLRSPAQAEEE